MKKKKWRNSSKLVNTNATKASSFKAHGLTQAPPLACSTACFPSSLALIMARRLRFVMMINTQVSTPTSANSESGYSELWVELAFFAEFLNTLQHLGNVSNIYNFYLDQMCPFPQWWLREYVQTARQRSRFPPLGEEVQCWRLVTTIATVKPKMMVVEAGRVGLVVWLQLNWTERKDEMGKLKPCSSKENVQYFKLQFAWKPPHAGPLGVSNDSFFQLQ